MHKNLREYTEFLIGIGKKFCAYSEAEDSLRMTSIQQQVMTGYMIQEDLIAAKKLQIPPERLPDILLKFSLYLVDTDSNQTDFLTFIKEEAISQYYSHCQAYLNAIWGEKNAP